MSWVVDERGQAVVRNRITDDLAGVAHLLGFSRAPKKQPACRSLPTVLACIESA
jgi:hypothetical protein